MLLRGRGRSGVRLTDVNVEQEPRKEIDESQDVAEAFPARLEALSPTNDSARSTLLRFGRIHHIVGFARRNVGFLALYALRI
jgi:hypothetical protein